MHGGAVIAAMRWEPPDGREDRRDRPWLCRPAGRGRHGAGARCGGRVRRRSRSGRGLARRHRRHRRVPARRACRPSTVRYTADPADLAGCTCFILTVPTPIDANRQPDLGALRRACGSVGAALRPGGIVVVESTVYPGVTEEVCGPLLATASACARGRTSSSATRPSASTPATASTGWRPSPR